ncbi:hypothetical protein BDV24DRAFT_178385 [Aspergillus arachidicola]|uniref:AMP-dependent synthetase/ligase domain-containing protein n=1 Tax=Aspergillus arachidicola TaxID=656916 RepID=A0A5N6XUG5_9EURO|nr:hypothetical protein BDV24DRAFT_178385 [Aspergillus arachidicola]
MPSNIALVHSPQYPKLWNKTLGSLTDEQEALHGDKSVLVVPWQSVTLSYRQLAQRSRVLAKAMLEMGLHHGDCVGIITGNCYQYIEGFLRELRNAVIASSCKLGFFSPAIGSRSLGPNLTLPELRRMVLLASDAVGGEHVGSQEYGTFTSNAHSVFMNDSVLKQMEQWLSVDDVLNLQNLINNAHFVGDTMKLTPDDIICCPPPLFHCSGLVMGFLASSCYGGSLIFPSDYFNAKIAVDCMVQENATVILGVPTMYIAKMEVAAQTGHRSHRLRTGIVSGSTISLSLVKQVQQCMGVGKTPLTCITGLEDSDEKRATTVGRVMPHTTAKVINTNENTLRRGERGELCASGPSQTREVMKRDENGILERSAGSTGVVEVFLNPAVQGGTQVLGILGSLNLSPREHRDVSRHTIIGTIRQQPGATTAVVLRIQFYDARAAVIAVDLRNREAGASSCFFIL